MEDSLTCITEMPPRITDLCIVRENFWNVDIVNKMKDKSQYLNKKAF